MKKGLILALLMVAVVAMAFPAYAKAPTIKDLPEIVIGDAGDITAAGTTGLRLYKYVNALNLFDSNVITWPNGTLANVGNYSKYHVFLSKLSGAQTVLPSKTAALVNLMTTPEATALFAGTGTGGTGTDIIDPAGAGFGWLSLINMTLVGTTAPTSAYTATAATNGMTLAAINTAMPSVSSSVDFVMAAAECDLPSGLSTLVASKTLTVTTMKDVADYTTGLAIPVLTYNFPAGNAQSWYCLTNQGVTGFGVATTYHDTVSGGIGWNAGTTTLVAGETGTYGTWYLSDNGANAKFLIPGGGMTGKVYRVKANLKTDQTARTTVSSYRLFAISYLFTALQGIQVVTSAPEAEIPAPTSTTDLEAQIHFAVPYQLNEFDELGALKSLSWSTLVGDANAPGDARNYCLTFDGLDIGDAGWLVMDNCIVESYARPADRTEADSATGVKDSWGTGGSVPFNDATNGYALATSSPYDRATLGTDGILEFANGASNGVTANQVAMEMGSMPTGSAAGEGRWNQAAMHVATTTHRYVERATDLVRYTVTYSSPVPNTAPHVRFQTFAINASNINEAIVWYDCFGPKDTRSFLNAATYRAPGTPKTAGSVIDLYRYVAATDGSHWLHFFWDAYGVPVATGAQTTNNWASQTGQIIVTKLVRNGQLAQP